MPACRWVRFACERHLSDLQRSQTDEYPFRFDEAKAAKPVKFIELLPHTKGDWAARRELIRLEPWQKFIVCSLYGWVSKDTGLRRFRTAYVCVPRKNAKSTLSAGLGVNALVADGEFGAEVYCGATSEKQALEVFRPAKLMVRRTPKLQQMFGIEVNAKNLARPDDGSRMEPLIGDPGDGASPSFAIVDEYHEHLKDNLFDTMSTGMGARRQPLMLVITTAGSNIGGPCYLLQSEVQKVLEGAIEGETTFGIIYTIDEEDDWTSEEALRKANPNFGISVMRDFLLDQQDKAVQSARKQNIFKTKHLNIWCGANTAWMNMQKWKACADASLRIEDFLGERAWIGVDLSSTTDISAKVLVFKRLVDEKEHFYVFGSYYLPEEKAQDPEKQHYQQWLHDGLLVGIPGPTIDYSVIRKEIEADAERFDVRAVAFDPWAAVETQQELQRQLGEDKIITIPQNTKYLSHPMKSVEALVLEKRIHHDGNPALMWMVSNVVAHEDANENILPRKEKPEAKIDGAVALIMSAARALADDGSTDYLEFNGF